MGKRRKQRAGSRRPRPAPEAAAPESLAPPTPPAPAATQRQTLIQLGAAVLSGTLWFLACADFDIWPLAWLAMVPGLWAIEAAPTRRRAILNGWVIGVVANAGGFYWIINLLVRFAHLPLPVAMFGLLLLAAYQGVVFALFAWAYRSIRGLSRERLGAALPAALVAPVVMVALEIVVPFLFPWYLAITQAWVVPIIQIADITGPVGVTALLCAVNGAIWDVATAPTRRRRIVPALAAAGAVAVALVYGAVRIHQVEARRAAAHKLPVGVVQGNIPFDEKGVDRADLAAAQLAQLQNESVELEAKGARFLMWTETSYPYLFPRDLTGDLPAEARARIRRGFESPLLFGAMTKDRTQPGKPPYNSAILLGQDGQFAGRFDKIFLLMFGEYIPLADTFPSIKKIVPAAAGHLTRGEGITTLPLTVDGQTYRLGPMICYEDILTDFSRELLAQHPHLLVNITNDAWFGDTSEPWEHLALSVYRSVEGRLDLVRAVNTGVSAFVDATGRVYAESYAVDPKITPKPVDSLLAEVALMEGGHTFYARFGDLFGYLCVVLTAAAWFVWPRVRRKRSA